MAVVEIALLGDFDIRGAGNDVSDLPGQKERALLALLAARPDATHSRERLSSLLWSDRGDSQARDSLKHALAKLRHCLKPADTMPIVSDRQSVRLDLSSLRVDLVDFQRLLKDGTVEAVEQALKLYRGDLLEGISVRDPAFEEWLLIERQRLRNLAEDAAADLLSQSLAEGVQERAATAARRLFELDPFREQACRALMQIYAERGEGAQALKLYETLRERLQCELGVAPEPETAKLCDAIRQGRLAVSSPLAEARPAGRGAPQELPLPDKPSIAVLPFENLSGDAGQEYFADGIVEEIITALSRISWLFVIARNSSFAYKGRAIDVKQIGRELGVRYVLEGSVRKAETRVRITGRLIDATVGTHLWADSFDGEIADIFELQDQVTASVVGELAPMLERAEIERAKRKPTGNLDAYDYYLRGLAGVHKWTQQGNVEALHMFTRAFELDPEFASAYGMAARCYSQRKACGWVTEPQAEIAEVRRLAQKAVQFGQDDAVALTTAGIGLAFVAGDIDDGLALIDQARALDPNLAMAWLFSAWTHVWLGEPDVAIEDVARAIRLSPHDPQLAMMHAASACAHFFAGRYSDATVWAEKSVRLQPNYRIATCILAASRGLEGRIAEAKQAGKRLQEIDPNLRISNLLDSYPMRRQGDFAKWAEGLRLAGVSE